MKKKKNQIIEDWKIRSIFFSQDEIDWKMIRKMFTLKSGRMREKQVIASTYQIKDYKIDWKKYQQISLNKQVKPAKNFSDVFDSSADLRKFSKLYPPQSDYFRVKNQKFLIESSKIFFHWSDPSIFSTPRNSKIFRSAPTILLPAVRWPNYERR